MGGGNSNMFLFSSLFGEDFQFDYNIFQMGRFNHQLVMEGILRQFERDINHDNDTVVK